MERVVHAFPLSLNSPESARHNNSALAEQLHLMRGAFTKGVWISTCNPHILPLPNPYWLKCRGQRLKSVRPMAFGYY
jgi:hypothetical protein